MSSQDLYELFKNSSGVSTDTRKLGKGNLFFALSGENFNGNKFADQALEKGASAAVIDDPNYQGDQKILVDDALQTLQDLALKHRENFDGPVLAITGSNGKTTTKELVREVLATKYRVQATEGNLNNHIGVPLSILKWTEDTEIAIVEMGANHVGEIASYCQYTRPTHGLITNIGHAHTEGFGGIEGVLRGKTELFDSIRKSEGTAFINVRDERLKHLTRRFEAPVVFPEEDLKLEPSGESLAFSLNGQLAESKLTGEYNFMNIAVAVSVGRHFNVPDEEILSAIENYTPTNHRSQIIKKGDLTIILDAYNANPDSMREALRNLAKFEGKKIAVLGDMNELSNSDDEHRSLGMETAKLLLDEVVLVGKKIKPATEVISSAIHFETTEELIGNWRPEGPATILIKASRSIKLESIVDKF